MPKSRSEAKASFAVSPWQTKRCDTGHIADTGGSLRLQLYSEVFVPLVRHCARMHASCTCIRPYDDPGQCLCLRRMQTLLLVKSNFRASRAEGRAPAMWILRTPNGSSCAIPLHSCSPNGRQMRRWMSISASTQMSYCQACCQGNAVRRSKYPRFAALRTLPS
jgi:hypothetical protein